MNTFFASSEVHAESKLRLAVLELLSLGGVLSTSAP
jgi:hypothetical protein